MSLLAFSAPQPAQAQDSGGHYWQTVYSQTGNWSYDDRDMPTTGQTTPHNGLWPTTGNGYGVGGGGEVDGSLTNGTITATLTWIPATGQTLQSDPPPAQLNIVEYGDAWFGSNWGGSAMPDPSSGVADDGLGDTPVSSSNGYNTWTSTSQGYHVVQKDASSGTVTVTCSPSASNPPSSYLPYPNFPSYHYWDWSAGLCVVSFSVYPVTLDLSGTTLDSNGNQDILIGQHCSASLSGLPSFPDGYTVSYQWSVSGSTFQTWSADTPSFPVMVGGVQIGIIPENPDATYEVDGPGPLTNSTAGWYWNDLAKGTGNNTQETVSCTATVTPPTGQGAALTVTATTPITVWTPVWTATGNGASVVVDNTFQAPDFWLHAGPGPLDFGATHGMTWYASLSPPSAPVPFGIGSLAIVQIITGDDQGMTSNTTPPLSIPGPANGQTGLDTSWPYGWTISTTIVGGMKYESGDSPGIRVTNLRSAHDNISFEDYLMYCPPSSVQYVPLAKYIWSANMGASLPATGNWINFTGTAGTVTDAQKTGQFLPNNTFPAWTDIVTAQ